MKPLGRKAYGSIGHLPASRLGPGDHHVTEGQARIVTTKKRDRRDVIFVEEKLDGSCVAVARLGSVIHALGRAGYLAQTSKYEQHQLFAAWVREQEDRFRAALEDGERMVGEWLAQAHGTLYTLPHEPFVAFDVMVGERRHPRQNFDERVAAGVFVRARRIWSGEPMTVEAAMAILNEDRSVHGSQEPIEGAVWRVERDGEVDFLAKYLRPDKVDGCYLPEMSGKDPIWNWRP